MLILNNDGPDAGACHNNPVVGCGLLLDEREPPDDGAGPYRKLKYVPKGIFVRPLNNNADTAAILSGIGDYSDSHGAFIITPRWSSPVTQTFPQPLDLGTGKRVASATFKRYNIPLGDAYVVTDYYCEGASFGDDCWVADLTPPPGHGIKRATIFVILTRFRSMDHVLLLRPLYDERFPASFTAVVDQFLKAARLGPDLTAELGRLSGLAASTRERYAADYARAAALIAQRTAPQPEA
ncbi:hypothetical protein GPECTOR_902g156 [Gonium pectorale]|uniref:Uncharacterized protein n=1 Tax=Gonium pectorale TaxID=33097 RepID=A0A150FVJ5_GONPE|nr:hypothetical protein GPECTOR_902g156 [Gonium pectorale]|eukprot:KXZ41050.1 hypothetical protein GPECTOR_902g156 [Gonium pectorale]